MQVIPELLQIGDPALFAIDEHHRIADLQAGPLEWRNRLQYAVAGGDQIVDDDGTLANLPDALNRLAGAVALGRLARVNERFVHFQAQRCANGQPRQGRRRDQVKGERLQNGARNAASVMTESRSQAQSTVEEGSKADESLSRILQAVSSIHGMNQQIASAAEEQSVTAQKISANVNKINEAGGEIVSNSDEIGASTQSLTALSGQLDSLVHQFKV